MIKANLLVPWLLAAFLAVLLLTKFGYLDRLDAAILAFARLADDPQLLRGGAKFTQAVKDITALGGLTFLFMITAITAGYLWIIGRPRFAFVILASILSGWMVSASLKLVVARARPDIVPHLVVVHDSSFPSGHALVAAVTYLTLGALLASIQVRRLASIYILTTAGLLTVLVGSSRIFLGVHFPSDVLAGWLLGAAWAMICLAIARRTLLRGAFKG